MKKRFIEKSNGLSLFERLKSGLEDSIAFAKGKRRLRTIDLPDEPPPLTGADVTRIRRDIDLSQVAFARLLNVSLATLRSWERGQRSPSRTALRLLQVVRELQGDILSLAAFSRAGGPQSLATGRTASGSGKTPIEK